MRLQAVPLILHLLIKKMKALYTQAEYEPGKHRIFYAIPDAFWFYFSHTTNIPLALLEIDELVPDNQEICRQLKIYGSYLKVDAVGDNKYYIKIENNEPVLYEKDGWEEHIEDYF